MAAQRSEKQQALVAKYQTRDITIDNVADIVNDIFDVVDNVANPLSWFQLFADGWSIANMSSSQANAAQNLQDLVDKVSGMASDLDEIKQTLAEQGLTQDEINAKLDIIMAQQQADTEAILNSISDVGSMVSQMWANTVSWLSSMQQQLSAVQDMLRGINDAIKDLVAQLDQLKSEVQWGSIVGTMAEYQLRISYACEMAQNIYVGTSSNNTESSSSDQAPQAPQTQYDAQELTRWAREVTSLASGIQYHLDGMHKLIMGDYVLGKPLMYLYALTFANAAVPDPKAARIYAYMVAVQCQGFATLAKAREFLGLRSLGDVKALCKARIDEQIEVVSASYLAAAKDGAWVGANGPTAMQYATQPLSGTRVIIVDNNRDVVSGLRLGPTNNNVQLLTSALVPGTSRVENQYKTVDKAHDGGIVRWYYCCQTTNSPNAVVNVRSTHKHGVGNYSQLTRECNETISGPPPPSSSRTSTPSSASCCRPARPASSPSAPGSGTRTKARPGGTARAGPSTWPSRPGSATAPCTSAPGSSTRSAGPTAPT